MREFLIQPQKPPKKVQDSTFADPADWTPPPEPTVRTILFANQPSAAAAPPARPAQRPQETRVVDPRGTDKRPPQRSGPMPRPADRKTGGADAAKKPGNRSFVVSYAGSFVGFFEADVEVRPKEAFLRIAADFASRDPHFDAQKLELYRPVLVRSARAPAGMTSFRGRFRRVGHRKRR
ncbi:MAG TPA: hypothetical protein VFD71_20735 [Planctomycetota bacterium]|jgi:hypothetical protein|nr:hypothetical protein [Planctomycetota bacterium]